ncbi:MAG TPA: cell division protein FtsL, partial [Vicinamibacteria bacterium]|nr:cell division protein FtsL [Vicinamibacteria bacterium]
PRSRREIFLVVLLVALLAAGLGLYAWPALEIRRAGQTSVELYREKERLLEERRKLQLEKAALENLKRVEAIATRELGLQTPAPEQAVVVELPRPVPPASTIAEGTAPHREARADKPAERPKEARP